MIIGVDAGCLGIRDERLKVGVYQVAKNLFLELAKQDKINTYLLYSFYPIEKNLLKTFGKSVKNIVVKPARGWTKIWLPLRLLKDKPDIFVGLNQSLPLKLPFQTYKSIVMIHDVLFEQHPKLYSGSFRKLHKESLSAARIADVILAPSEATKKDLINLYKISKEKILVAHEGVRGFTTEKDSSTSSGMKRNGKYFLFVGALKPQKNVPVLLDAFAKVEKDVNLLIVGGDKWKDKRIDAALKKLSKDIQGKIRFLGTLTDNELANTYRNAIAFVSPSLSEGFGLPFLEALSFGIPVIGPKTGAVPEIVGDAGILVDPTNTRHVVRGMEKMLDTAYRFDLSKKAKQQAAKFSWEKFASQFLMAIERLR